MKIILKITITNRFCSFTYNALGQRTRIAYTFTEGRLVQADPLTSKTVDYVYDSSGRLIKESRVSTYKQSSSESCELLYLYDESGIIGVVYSSGSTSSTYYFQRNLQGDVIGIYDTSGTKVGGYAYDAWGNCTITNDTTNYSVAYANPIRYRGYYYDADTGLYYLNARYYNPQWRRFISPDDTGYLDPETPNGLNLYAYCNNDPVNYADPSGHSIIASILIGAAIGAGIGFGFSLTSELIENDFDISKVNWNLVIVDTVFGAIDGALSAMGLSVVASLLIQPALAGLQTIIGATVSGEINQLSIEQVFFSIAFSAIMIGTSSALTKYCKIPTGYDTFQNHKIRKVSNNYLKTIKSSGKAVLYKGKIKATRIQEIAGTLGYIGFTSLSNFSGNGLDELLEW